MGTSLLCHDDPHYLAFVLQAIHEIIHIVLQASSIDAAIILKLFVTALDHIPTYHIHQFERSSSMFFCQAKLFILVGFLVWGCAVQRVVDDPVEYFLINPTLVAMQALYETMRRLIFNHGGSSYFLLNMRSIPLNL